MKWPSMLLTIFLLSLLPETTHSASALAQQPAPEPLQVEVIATGLNVPWSLAFTPDGWLLFTQRPCQVRALRHTGGGWELIAEPVLRPSDCIEVADGDGLRGLALDPAFQQNGYLYLAYSYQDSSGQILTRVSRFTRGIGNELVLLEGIPDNAFHNAGRLKFGPDGRLYLATGDANDRTLPQDSSSLAGKILRFNPNGSLPEDNPFPGSPVYSLGHRNPQGLAWHPDTGQLFITEHGPSATIAGEPFFCCHDEINSIVAGGNHGWPLAIGAVQDARFIPPVLESGTDTWAPAGAAFYRSLPGQEWHGNLFFVTLLGQHLHRVVFQEPDFRSVAYHQRLLQGQYGRLRDVIQGPDGALYISTSNRDGRSGAQAGPKDDRILRVVLLKPTDQRATVQEAYLATLARQPEPGGLTYWANAGLSWPELLAALRISPEGLRVTAVRGIYIELLGRDPLGSDNGGLRAWVDAPLSLEDIRATILASPEYRQRAA